MSIEQKLPEILKNNAYTTLEPLEAAMQEKVNYIQFCYSKDLTEQQMKRVKQDEALLKSIQKHVTTLNGQIDYLLKEYKTMQLMALKCHSELIEVRGENIKLLAMAARKQLEAFKLDEA